jgi:hypothetical protein
VIRLLPFTLLDLRPSCSQINHPTWLHAIRVSMLAQLKVDSLLLLELILLNWVDRYYLFLQSPCPPDSIAGSFDDCYPLINLRNLFQNGFHAARLRFHAEHLFHLDLAYHPILVSLWELLMFIRQHPRSGGLEQRFLLL